MSGRRDPGAGEPRSTHLDPQGRVRMVDVGDRPVSDRQAIATASVRVSAAAARAIETGAVGKGDVLEICRLAGIMAAKRTPELIPLCHPIAISHVAVEAELEDGRVMLRASVRCRDATGVEMEALTAVAVAGLTVIDMIKSIDPWAEVGEVRLEAKSGGRSGSVVRPPGSPAGEV